MAMYTEDDAVICREFLSRCSDSRFASTFLRFFTTEHNTNQQSFFREAVIPAIQHMASTRFVDDRNQSTHEFCKAVNAETVNQHFPYI